MGREASQHLCARRRREEAHDIARAHDGVESLSDAAGGQVEVGQVADQPGGSGVVVVGSLDEGGVDIHADHGVAQVVEAATHASGAAARVQDACVAGDHRVDHPGFAVEVVTVGGHVAEALDVADRVTGVGGHDLFPLARFGGHVVPFFS